MDNWLKPFMDLGIAPFFVEKAGIIFLGDCLELLPQFPKADLCIVDPPYNIGSPQLITDMRTVDKRKVGKDFGSFDKNAPTPQQWFRYMPDLVLSFYDALKVHALIKAAEEAGFEAVQDFHWMKKNAPVPMRAVGFAWGTETGYVFRRKGVRHKFNTAPGISPNWFMASLCAGKERTEHPTQKKLSVVKWLCMHWSFPGDTILDFALGSGTTAVAAKELGRRYVGIEVNPEYCEIAVRRVVNCNPPLFTV